jgi:hypothetical protein
VGNGARLAKHCGLVGHHPRGSLHHGHLAAPLDHCNVGDVGVDAVLVSLRVGIDGNSWFIQTIESIEKKQTSGVVAAVLETLQAVNEELDDLKALARLRMARISNNSAHIPMKIPTRI